MQDNLNPLGRTYYAFSNFLCTPCSLAQEVGLALGAQAGEARIREVVTRAGFGRFRRVAESMTNAVGAPTPHSERGKGPLVHQRPSLCIP